MSLIYFKIILIIIIYIQIFRCIYKQDIVEGFYECVDSYGTNIKNVLRNYIPSLTGYTKNDYFYKSIPLFKHDDPFGTIIE